MKKSEILAAFEKLNEELGRQGIHGEIGVVGGAAMVLAFNARGSTKDVDAIFEPSSKIRAAAKNIAEEMGLPDDWINDAVKGHLPGEPDTKKILFKKEHLTVWVPEPQYLLAMKGIAARFDTHDALDLVFLINHLRIQSAEKVLEVIQKYYPKDRIPVKTQYFIEELFDDGTFVKHKTRK